MVEWRVPAAAGVARVPKLVEQSGVPRGGRPAFLSAKVCRIRVALDARCVAFL